jgi:hypothetical protein
MSLLSRSAAWRWGWIPFIAACTGTVVPPGAGSGGDTTSTGTLPTAPTAPTTTFNETGPNTIVSECVDLDPSKWDQSCETDADCSLVPSGTLCSGYTCSCPSGTVSSAVQAQYDAAVASVQPGSSGCGCPVTGTARCISGQCVFCPASFGDGGLQFICPVDGG